MNLMIKGIRMKKFTEFLVDDLGVQGTVLLERMVGSRLYGTKYEKGEHPFISEYVSDYDYRSIHIINPLHKLKLKPFSDFIENVKLPDFDSESCEIQKFFVEASKNQPHVMDLLYGSEKSLIGANNDGLIILKHRNDFLTNQIADSFKGFAQAQLKRIENHHEWFIQYPDIYDVQETLLLAYLRHEVDHDIISNLFSGELAFFITNEDPNSKKIKSSLSANDMLLKYFSKKTYQISNYIKPHVLHYMTLQSNTGFKVNITPEIELYLEKEACFKVNSEKLLFIYNNGKGIFTPDGNIQPKAKVKPHQNEPIYYIAHIDKVKFNNARDHIKSLWSWKVNRNQTRSALEERFGYDVKHGMHTYRLLESAIKTLNNGTYTPELSGEMLEFAKYILAGKLPYSEFLKLVEQQMKILNDLKNLNLLPSRVNEKKISDIYNNIILNNIY